MTSRSATPILSGLGKVGIFDTYSIGVKRVEKAVPVTGLAAGEFEIRLVNIPCGPDQPLSLAHGSTGEVFFTCTNGTQCVDIRSLH